MARLIDRDSTRIPKTERLLTSMHSRWKMCIVCKMYKISMQGTHSDVYYVDQISGAMENSAVSLPFG